MCLLALCWSLVKCTRGAFKGNGFILDRGSLVYLRVHSRKHAMSIWIWSLDFVATNREVWRCLVSEGTQETLPWKAPSFQVFKWTSSGSSMSSRICAAAPPSLGFVLVDGRMQPVTCHLWGFFAIVFRQSIIARGVPPNGRWMEVCHKEVMVLGWNHLKFCKILHCTKWNQAEST